MSEADCPSCGWSGIPDLAGDTLWCPACGELIADMAGGTEVETRASRAVAMPTWRQSGIAWQSVLYVQTLRGPGRRYREWMPKLTPTGRKTPEPICEGQRCVLCERMAMSRGLCGLHYGRAYRAGKLGR